MDAKALKVQFVSGHGGTTFAETVAASSVILSAALCHATVLGCLPSSLLLHRAALLAAEFMLLVVPLAIALTWTELIPALHLGCIVVGVIGHLWRPPPLAPLKHVAVQRWPYLEGYRSMLMLTTCFSILAVDFPVFPRRFAKTEMFGISVMDVGTGCFIFSNALVYGGRQLREGEGAWRRTFASFTPLLALGLVRLAFIKGADYHEVVEEYGVHWNFFFTLAGLPLLMLLSSHLPVLRALPSLPLGLLVLAAYQAALSHLGLTEYVEGADRSNLIAANKEGLASLGGYFGLYCVGAGVGRSLFRHPRAVVGGTLRDRMAQPQVRVVAAAFSCAALAAAVLHTTVQPTSRRLCNAAYVAFTVAYNLWFVGIFMLLQLIHPMPPQVASAQSLLPAVNANQLACFLLGNVLTGLTNMSIDTVHTTPAAAYTVLLLYMAVLVSAMAALQRTGLRLRM
eukprot:GGOE01049941.1.p1 GENE.GGOE01049941.1~~GGOE01049941.1.p1  ORF type:complete len:470 (+),score=129.61 GGOE01049941.1:53-1411(+)